MEELVKVNEEITRVMRAMRAPVRVLGDNDSAWEHGRLRSQIFKDIMIRKMTTTSTKQG